MAIIDVKPGMNQVEGTELRDEINLKISAGDGIVINAKGGSDIINVLRGNGHIINAGDGVDFITVSGGSNHYIDLGEGNDRVDLWGNEGHEVNAVSGTNNININNGSDYLITGGTGIDKLIIKGNNSNNIAYLAAGDDVLGMATGSENEIHGGEGNDYFIVSGGENSTFYGDEGNDTLRLYRGDGHTLYAGEGNDAMLVTEANNSKIYGINGKNQIMFFGGIGNEYYGGEEKDNVTIKYNAQGVKVTGGAQATVVNIQAGDAHIIDLSQSINTVTQVMAGADTVVTGGKGRDTLSIWGTAEGLTADLGDGNDIVNLKGGSDIVVMTGSGSDTISLSGEVVNSSVEAGDGNDIAIIHGGTNNTINMGAGDNTLTLNGGSDNIVTLDDGNATVTVNGGSNTFIVGAGNDTITVNGGSVGDINGESGTNTIVIKGGQVNSITGAYVGTGSTSGNTITVEGGTIEGNIIGSTNDQGGSVLGNVVTISGGSFAQDADGKGLVSVYGGLNRNDVVNNNSVQVSAGNFASIFGGLQGLGAVGGTGIAVNNQVVVNGDAVAEEVVGGQGTAQCTTNMVIVEGKAKISKVTGGIGTYGDTASNKVIIQGEAQVEGRVSGAIFDGKGKRVDSNWVTLSDNAEVGSVVGAHVIGEEVSGTGACGNIITLNGMAKVDRNIYALYTEQAGGYNAGNIVNINENSVIDGSVWAVYALNGAADMNEIHMSGGSVTNFQWLDDRHYDSKGGEVTVARTVDGNASSGKLEMSGGEAVILRGGRAVGNGNASYNQIKMTGGTAVAVDGGYSNNGKANDNHLYITGGNVVSNIEGFAARILGGRTKTGEAGYNEVVVKDMRQKDLRIIGGQAILDTNTQEGQPNTGLVRGNVVNVSDSQVKLIVGGQNNTNGLVNSNYVTVSNTLLSENLTTAAIAQMKDDIYSNAVVGSIGSCSKINGSRVTVSGGQISAVYGAVNKASKGAVEDNIVQLQNETIINYNVYGALNTQGDAIANKVIISNANVMGYDKNISGGDGGMIYGGCTTSGMAKGNEVSMTDGLVYLLRGGRSASGNAVENVVNINGGVVDYVEGGRSNNAQAIANKIVVKNGTVNEAVRGGRVVSKNPNSDVVAIAKDNVVEIKGGSFKNVYGGFATTSGDISNNSVSIENATISGSVWGGYTPGGRAVENNVTINDKTTILGSVYNSVGTENEIDDNMGNISISGSSTQVSGKVCGGVGKDKIVISGAQIMDSIDGGTGDDTIEVYGAKVSKIYGSDGNDTISAFGSTVESIDGGDGNDSFTLISSSGVTITGGAGDDTYIFSQLGANEVYTVNEKDVAFEENETFDFSAFKEEDFVVMESTANGDRIYQHCESGGRVIIKEFKSVKQGGIIFSDNIYLWKTELPRYTDLQAAEFDFETSSVSSSSELLPPEENKLQIFSK